MKSLAERLLSIVCVCIMLIAGLQVLSINVAASEPSDALATGDAKEPLARLTVSNIQASLPSASTSGNYYNIAWADGVSPSMTLRWKCSSDNGSTFTADQTISPPFYSISNVNIACGVDGATAIVFNGQYTIDDPECVYVICSGDNGGSWTQVSLVSPASEAAIAVHDGNVIVGLNRLVDGNNYFFLVEMRINGTKLDSGTTLTALRVENSKIEIFATEEGVYYLLLPKPSDREIVYGAVTFSGLSLVQPRVIWSVTTGYVADIDLCVDFGRVDIGISYNEMDRAYIEFGPINETTGYWDADLVGTEIGS